MKELKDKVLLNTGSGYEGYINFKNENMVIKKIENEKDESYEYQVSLSNWDCSFLRSLCNHYNENPDGYVHNTVIFKDIYNNVDDVRSISNDFSQSLYNLRKKISVQSSQNFAYNIIQTPDMGGRGLYRLNLKELPFKDDNIIFAKKVRKTISDIIKEDKFNDELFGNIELENKEYSLISSIENLPKILVLVGDGGVGKTMHLEKFCAETLQNDKVLPIFLSLYNKDPDNSIMQDIVNTYPAINGDEPISEEKLKPFFDGQKSFLKYIIILDGLNEYKGKRTKLFREINQISGLQNVSFIITSRYSCRDYIDIDKALLDNITEASINHITDQQAINYLGTDIKLSSYDGKTRDLLKTPFYISIIKNSEIDISKIVNINSSMLMYKYMERNIELNGKYDTVIRLVFPYICYLRYKEESLYEILGQKSENTFFNNNTIAEAVKLYNDYNFFYTIPTVEDVVKVLIDCNLIVKRNGLGPIQYSFKHQNIRDTYAALHVANTVFMIAAGRINSEEFGSEIDLHAEMEDFTQEMKNSIHILCEAEHFQEKELIRSQNLIVLEALIKNSSGDIEAGEYSEAFVEKYEALADDSLLKLSLSEMYISALCMLAKNYRRLKYKTISDLESFQRCLECGLKAKELYDNNEKLNSDGYNHIGKCLNSYMEYVIKNNGNVPINDTYPLITMARENLAYAGTVLSNTIQEGNKINSALQLILNAAKEAYYAYYEKNERDERVLSILLLHYVSRAYLADACLKNSAESLNLMAMILENDYNIRFRNKIREIFNEDIAQFVSFGENRLDFCYSLYSRASRRPHVVRGYSSMKIASLLIKNEIDAFKDDPDAKRKEIENNLDYAGRVNQSMISYWKGRYYCDLLNDYSKAKSYYETELQKYSNNFQDINIPLMLVKIERIPFYKITNKEKVILRNLSTILSYDTLNADLVPDNNGIYTDLRYIIHCLNYQKSNLNEDMRADNFWVTEETVKENIQRFLGNLEKLIN